MWLFTQHGFFSVTVSRDDKRMMQIRARSPRHLEALKQRFGLQNEILTTPRADYRWRIVVRKKTAHRLIAELAEEIDYSNFKDRCHETGADDAPLMQVWSTMHRFQHDTEFPPKKHVWTNQRDFSDVWGEQEPEQQPEDIGDPYVTPDPYEEPHDGDWIPCPVDGCVLEHGHDGECITEEQAISLMEFARQQQEQEA